MTIDEISGAEIDKIPEEGYEPSWRDKAVSDYAQQCAEVDHLKMTIEKWKADAFHAAGLVGELSNINHKLEEQKAILVRALKEIAEGGCACLGEYSLCHSCLAEQALKKAGLE